MGARGCFLLFFVRYGLIMKKETEYPSDYRNRQHPNIHISGGTVLRVELSHRSGIRLYLSHRFRDDVDERLEKSILLFDTHAKNNVFEVGDEVYYHAGLRFDKNGHHCYVCVSHPKQHWIKKIKTDA